VHWFAGAAAPQFVARHDPTAQAVGAGEPAAHEEPTGQAIAETLPGQYVPVTQVAAEQAVVWLATEDVPAPQATGAVAPSAQ